MGEMTTRHVVIMAGGIGSRFWPMSTSDYPKQFLDVMGVGKSLLQLTVERFLPICPIQNIWVVTSERYTEIVKQQLPDLSVDNILAEPVARNTAPCIGYACWKIYKKYPHANIVVSPTDALVIDTSEFRRVVCEALKFTDVNRAVVTIGIKPSRPETGYGYICTAGTSAQSEIIHVEAFKEKPDVETAKKYLSSGNYLWNAGLFVWNVQTIMGALRSFTPDLAAVMDEMAVDFYTDREAETVKRLFSTCQRISIDYAVMEKIDEIYTIPAAFGWSDLGTWGSLKQMLPSDGEGNAVVGQNVQLYNCQNCIVHIKDGERTVLEGLDGYIISEYDGRLLVCRLSEEQHIKEFSEL